MKKDKAIENDDNLLRQVLLIDTQVKLFASCHRAITIKPRPTMQTSAFYSQILFKVRTELLNSLQERILIGQSDRILREIALIWRNQDSAHILEVLRHKTAFKEDSESYLCLSKIIKKQLENDVKIQVSNFFNIYQNAILRFRRRSEVWERFNTVDSGIAN
ncbi:MAG: hypothetical protein EZS28_002781 [Streblomastix strix]|uniref:Uncharacterized protein n=1 Tax=Streblomastix strix TaxID=222440 RepID=A0A5J4X4N3_9EUKA|nr:MAG: hypothetical protein EZS28_002781 [Streblomastix strix]